MQLVYIVAGYGAIYQCTGKAFAIAFYIPHQFVCIASHYRQYQAEFSCRGTQGIVHVFGKAAALQQLRLQHHRKKRCTFATGNQPKVVEAAGNHAYFARYFLQQVIADTKFVYCHHAANVGAGNIWARRMKVYVQ